MSDYKVPLTTIKEIHPHPNADRLQIATVYGFNVVIAKDIYKVGDPIFYVPVDSILSQEVEDLCFPKDSKIKLDKHRVRQIKIRSFPSQGLLIRPETLKSIRDTKWINRLKLEENYAEDLNIIKYEPPFVHNHSGPGTPRNKPLENPRFHKYNGVDNIKWLPSYFEGQQVVVQEKLHGSNCRAGYLPTSPNTLWKKFLKLIGLLPKYEYTYGSNNVQLQERGSSYTGFYGSDVYGNVLKKVDAFSKLKPGETIYGELIGPGIQANYTYGLKEHHFVLFDVKVEKEDGTQEFLDPEEVMKYAKERGFDMVPLVLMGTYYKEALEGCISGPSIYCPSQKVREGVVIKARFNYGDHGSKKALKWINPDYLNDYSNTDNH